MPDVNVITQDADGNDVVVPMDVALYARKNDKLIRHGFKGLKPATPADAEAIATFHMPSTSEALAGDLGLSKAWAPAVSAGLNAVQVASWGLGNKANAAVRAVPELVTEGPRAAWGAYQDERQRGASVYEDVTRENPKASIAGALAPAVVQGGLGLFAKAPVAAAPALEPLLGPGLNATAKALPALGRIAGAGGINGLVGLAASEAPSGSRAETEQAILSFLLGGAPATIVEGLPALAETAQQAKAALAARAEANAAQAAEHAAAADAAGLGRFERFMTTTTPEGPATSPVAKNLGRAVGAVGGLVKGGAAGGVPGAIAGAVTGGATGGKLADAAAALAVRKLEQAPIQESLARQQSMIDEARSAAADLDWRLSQRSPAVAEPAEVASIEEQIAALLPPAAAPRPIPRRPLAPLMPDVAPVEVAPPAAAPTGPAPVPDPVAGAADKAEILALAAARRAPPVAPPSVAAQEVAQATIVPSGGEIPKGPGIDVQRGVSLLQRERVGTGGVDPDVAHAPSSTPPTAKTPLGPENPEPPGPRIEKSTPGSDADAMVRAMDSLLGAERARQDTLMRAGLEAQIRALLGPEAEAAMGPVQGLSREERALQYRAGMSPAGYGSGPREGETVVQAVERMRLEGYTPEQIARRVDEPIGKVRDIMRRSTWQRPLPEK